MPRILPSERKRDLRTPEDIVVLIVVTDYQSFKSYPMTRKKASIWIRTWWGWKENVVQNNKL